MRKSIVAGLAVLLPLSVAGIAQQQPAAPAPAPVQIDRSILHVQVILDRLGFGPGVLNGKPGRALTNALNGFQTARGLPVTGKIDAPTLKALYPYRAIRPTRTLELDAGTLAGPFNPQLPTEPAAQAKLDAMVYRSPMEKLAEQFHTTPEVLAALNPPETQLTAGTKVTFPNALPSSRNYPADIKPDWRATLNALNVDANVPKASRVVVSKSKGTLSVYDAADRLVAQFTATMGSVHDPLPLGSWKIQGVARLPDWQMNPAILRTVSDKEPKRLIPPGPNNPVGVVWMDLNKQHYGIHGTNSPEKIGSAESNGCVRLTNWDAARVSLMVTPGTPAIFVA